MTQVNDIIFEEYNRCKNMNKCDANAYLAEKISSYLNEDNNIYCSILAENIISNNGCLNEEELNENPLAGIGGRLFGKGLRNIGGRLTGNAARNAAGRAAGNAAKKGLTRRIGEFLTKKGNTLIARNTRHLSHVNYVKGLQKAGLPKNITNKMSNNAATQANKFYQQAILDVEKQLAGKKVTQNEFDKMVGKRYRQIAANEVKANPNAINNEIARNSGRKAKNAAKNAEKNAAGGNGNGNGKGGNGKGGNGKPPKGADDTNGGKGWWGRNKNKIKWFGSFAALTAAGYILYDAKEQDDEKMKQATGQQPETQSSATSDIYSKAYGASYQNVNEKDYRVN